MKFVDRLNVHAILHCIYFEQTNLPQKVMPIAISNEPKSESNIKSADKETSQDEEYILSPVVFQFSTAIFSTNRQYLVFMSCDFLFSAPL
jgi:hypothetical protein